MPDVARLGTATDHGGFVTEATSHFTAGGQPIARQGDAVGCPLPGHEPSHIVAGSGKVTSKGQPVARIGDLCLCGAKLVGPPNGFTVGG